MINDIQISGHQLILQIRPIWYHDLVTLVCDQDAGSGETDALPDPDVAGYGQVIELGDVWDGFESFLEVLPVNQRHEARKHDQAIRPTATFLK
jgi:hypothetical protein